MATPTTSTPPRTRPRRESRFTEGSEVTRPDLLSQTSSNELFFTILSEMDEHERRRKRGGSNSSTESFMSNTATSPTLAHKGRENSGLSNHSGREARKSIIFGRRSVDGSRRSLDERPRAEFSLGQLGLGLNTREVNVSDIASKVKGRLRALTGERRKDIKPYPGT